MNLPFNLVDLLIWLFLLAGLVLGRKRGMTVELPVMIKWVSLVLVCSLVYLPAGDAIAAVGFFDPLASYLLAYLGSALALFLVFSIIQRRMAPKLVGSDIFGHAEYYLGMGSSGVRYVCILVVALAVLHARAFSESDLKAIDKYQEETYGSSVFPTLHSFQVEVFQRSLTGTFIEQNLGFLLIHATSANTPVVRAGADTSQFLQTAGNR